MPTAIQISDEFWKFLNAQKELGESFEDVIKRLINYDDKLKGGPKNE